MRKWSILLAMLFILFPTAVGVEAQGSGVIEGQVVNGTLDGVPLEALPVTLWILRGEEVEDSLQETTDGEGRFRFEDLDREGYAYQFEVEYKGVSYGSETMAFPEGENVLSVPFSVFEPTTSDAELRTERAHLILEFRPGVILVQEVQIFVNAGNTTYVGPTGEEGGATIHFSLPQGASGVQLVEGLMSCCVLETETGFASDRPIFPGVKQFVFTYELKYQSPSYTLSKGMAYPVNSLDVLVADVGAEVTAPNLTVVEPLSLEGGKYLHLTGENLTTADSVTLQFANLPPEVPEATPTAAATTRPGVMGWMVIGLASLGVLLALGYPFLKKRREGKG
jgi:hypothetical protein